MKRVVHIGQGKAATTALQKDVFPAFAKSQNTKYLDPENITRLIANPANKTKLSDSFLASAEVLVGPPIKWDHYLEINSEFFGPDTTILLVLRRPSGFLRSVYQQINHHSGLLLDPKTYFEGTDESLSKRFDPKCYDQARLVKLYADTFNEVIVQKFETVADLEFLRVAYGLSPSQMGTARLNLVKNSSNRSFSKTAVNLSMKLKWMFGTPAVDIEKGTIKRTLRFKIWRSLMQGVFDKLYPYKKYVLDWESLPKVDIRKLDSAYDEIPSFQHYVAGVRQPLSEPADCQREGGVLLHQFLH